MANDNGGKYITGILMLGLAALIYFFGSTLIPVSNCTGWGWINPLCLVDLGSTLIFGVLAAWTALFGIMIFALPSEKSIWAVLLYIALTLTIINVFIPDPIPLVDELVGVLFSGFTAVKTFSDSKVKDAIGF